MHLSRATRSFGWRAFLWRQRTGTLRIAGHRFLERPDVPSFCDCSSRSGGMPPGERRRPAAVEARQHPARHARDSHREGRSCLARRARRAARGHARRDLQELRRSGRAALSHQHAVHDLVLRGRRLLGVQLPAPARCRPDAAQHLARWRTAERPRRPGAVLLQRARLSQEHRVGADPARCRVQRHRHRILCRVAQLPERAHRHRDARRRNRTHRRFVRHRTRECGVRDRHARRRLGRLPSPERPAH